MNKEINIKITEAQYKQVIENKSIGNFDEALKNGKVSEKIAQQYLEQMGVKFIRNSVGVHDNLKIWDIECEYKEKTYHYEVKSDLILKNSCTIFDEATQEYITTPKVETGNIYIEKTSRDKNSGIDVTKAHVWMHILFHLNEIWIIKVDKLKEIIRLNNMGSALGGDIYMGKKTSNGFLFPRLKFQKYFKVVKYNLEVVKETVEA